MVRPWAAVKPPAADEKLAKLKEIAQAFGVKFDAEAGREGGGLLHCKTRSLFAQPLAATGVVVSQNHWRRPNCISRW